MFDPATLGFAIDLAHESGRNSRAPLTHDEVQRIVSEAQRLSGALTNGGMLKGFIDARVIALADKTLGEEILACLERTPSVAQTVHDVQAVVGRSHQVVQAMLVELEGRGLVARKKAGSRDYYMLAASAFVRVPPAQPDTEPTFISIEERNILLALRRIGPCQALAIASAKGWPPMRIRRVMQRLCAKGLAAPYMGSMYKITNAGIVSALESGDEDPNPHVRDPGACRFPPSWGQELGD